MSDSKDVNRIIDPAPAQTAISSIDCIACPSGAVKEDETKKVADKAADREMMIKDLSKTLRSINNVCDPINDYLKFRQCISPEVNVIIDLSQWSMVMYGIKAATKSAIDHDYMNIENPPDSLKESMIKAYSELDTVSDSFANSMKDVITLVQNKLVPSDMHVAELQRETRTVTRSPTHLLDSMRSKRFDDKLP